ncbi:MAG: AtpZ/AtpI family protein [Elusimicrobiaceae bacterium]|nr:AtpZ/AtpI family protein [Elusimicrobiaceae bacterium]MBQ3934130.1 AtpZ/AtpI family protein [Elusimicrobiaceae bacterium]
MRKEDHLIITGLGLEFCLIMCIGFFAGYFIDKKWDTLPYFTLVGAFCGFSLGLYILINTALRLSKKLEAPKEVKK